MRWGKRIDGRNVLCHCSRAVGWQVEEFKRRVVEHGNHVFGRLLAHVAI